MVNLCFHGIGTPDRTLEPGEAQFWLATSQFHELMRVIRQRPVFRLTFDDGNMSDVSIALPAILREGLFASFFVLAGRLGSRGSLSHGDLRALANAGMTIGSHGMHHRPWTQVAEGALTEELDEAARVIALAASAPVDQAALPFGSYDRRVLRALAHRQVRHVFTVDGGSARADAWLQSRYTVRSTDTPHSLERIARQLGDGRVRERVRSIKSFIKQWR